MKPLLNTLAAVALGTMALTAQAEALKVMTSGGFTAAYKLLGPQYAEQSGDTLDTLLGPSMGKAPEAIHRSNSSAAGGNVRPRRFTKPTLRITCGNTSPTIVGAWARRCRGTDGRHGWRDHVAVITLLAL
ncbi:hypothetical protein [Pseudomonas sp. 58 R 12]|nr:hypothetical protein [Pseudomonas sp. 58 R 12]